MHRNFTTKTEHSPQKAELPYDQLSAKVIVSAWACRLRTMRRAAMHRCCVSKPNNKDKTPARASRLARALNPQTRCKAREKYAAPPHLDKGNGARQVVCSRDIQPAPRPSTSVSRTQSVQNMLYAWYVTLSPLPHDAGAYALGSGLRSYSCSMVLHLNIEIFLLWLISNGSNVYDNIQHTCLSDPSQLEIQTVLYVFIIPDEENKLCKAAHKNLMKNTTDILSKIIEVSAMTPAEVTRMSWDVDLFVVISWGKTFHREQYWPYDSLCQCFRNHYLKQYDADNTSALSYIELASKHHCLDSTLARTISFCTHYSLDPRCDGLMIDEPIACLKEKKLLDADDVMPDTSSTAPIVGAAGARSGTRPWRRYPRAGSRGPEAQGGCGSRIAAHQLNHCSRREPEELARELVLLNDKEANAAGKLERQQQRAKSVVLRSVGTQVLALQTEVELSTAAVFLLKEERYLLRLRDFPIYSLLYVKISAQVFIRDDVKTNGCFCGL
ncbi:hypothetical protein HYPSUDRAFT_58659 [Hypholoma sublateritium FD-334 SS-4]|uniref:Uncharacterized protein n=1 Tax=Hypholoma sublateritium (strain FD-334 SS-4) TaxID=945553 RepID=A0A0D2LXZ2_HYPSF|nr:hypothetical protein HYPSUDRAFT_58659 [Hypholoma sublateritium FD-334 SS-4]